MPVYPGAHESPYRSLTYAVVWQPV